MTAYDVRARAQAGRSLAPVATGGKGQAITLTTKTTGTRDLSTGITPVTTTTQTGSGLALEYSTFMRSGIRNEAGSLIKAGDKQLLMSALNAAGTPLTQPSVNDTVTLADGSAWTITSVAPLSPAGTAIYFDCNIRGAA